MTVSGLSAAAGEYLRRVEGLLADIDADDRTSLLADLGDRLVELSDNEIVERLGSPEEFVSEYRRSADLGAPPPTSQASRSALIGKVLSVAALPFGALLLFSFGGQLIFGPFALAIEWILARLSPPPLRIAWSLVAGALTGEIIYLILDLHVPQVQGFLAVVAGLATAASAALLVNRTTRTDTGAPASSAPSRT